MIIVNKKWLLTRSVKINETNLPWPNGYEFQNLTLVSRAMIRSKKFKKLNMLKLEWLIDNLLKSDTS